MAAGSWILAPPLFNPTFEYSNDRRATVSAKIAELWALSKWCHTPYIIGNCLTTRHMLLGNHNRYRCVVLIGGGTSHDSWEKWWWESRYDNLRLRAIRYQMYSCHTRWSCLRHPVSTSILELIFTLLQWLPWSMLTYSLMMRCQDILVYVVVYIALVLLVYSMSPR
jgi:hypothetical protein